MIVRGAKVYVEGEAEGPPVILGYPVSPLGDIDQATGRILAGPARGASLAGAILVLPHTVGSSVGSYVIYGLRRRGFSPAAVLLGRPDITMVSGCALAGVPAASLGEDYGAVAELLSRCSLARVKASRSAGLEVSCLGAAAPSSP